MPLIQRVMLDGASVLLKFDGARGAGDNGPATVLISGGPLGDDFIRRELPSMDIALAEALLDYGLRQW